MTSTSPTVGKSETITNSPLASGLGYAGYYQELVVENQMGANLYMLREGGHIETVVSTSCSYQNPLVRIMIVGRNKCSEADYGQRSIRDPSKRIKEEYVFPKSLFADGPIFVRELGYSLGLQCDAAALEAVNPYARVNFIKEVREQMQRDFDSGRSSPIVVYTNLYDDSIQTLYLEFNNQLLGCKVDHYRDRPEMCVIALRREGVDAREAIKTYGYKFDVFDDGETIECFSLVLENNILLAGTDKKQVLQKLAEKSKEQRARYTRYEVDRLVEDAIEDKVKEVTILKQKIDLTKQEKDLNKYENSNLKSELTQVNEGSRKTHEMEMAEMKLSMAKLDTELAKFKAEAENATIRNKLEQDRVALEAARIKADSERSQADHKERQAASQNTSDQISLVGTIAKTAAIIAPIALSLYIWHEKQVKESEAALIGIALSKVLPAPVAPVVLGGVVCVWWLTNRGGILPVWKFSKCVINKAAGLSKMLGRKLKYSICSAAHTCYELAGRAFLAVKEAAESTVDVITNAVSTSVSMVRDLADTAIDVSGRLISKVVDTAKAVVHSAVSIVKDTVRTVSSLISNTCHWICGWFT